MANISIWDGTATFAAGMTPFGFYDNDLDFQIDAVKAAKFCGTRLGFPLMDVELQSGSLFACFEEAVSTYGNEIFQYKIRENYLSLEGSSTGSVTNKKLINPTLDRIVNISKNYGTEAEVGGYVTRHTGSLALTSSVQVYNLDTWAEDNGIVGGIEIRRIFYEAPPAIMRYFDPYAGTGTGAQSLMDGFGFGGMSPGMNFMLMPASFDLLKVQGIEFNDQIRRAAYTFQLVNNDLTIFPVPKRSGDLRFEFYKISEKKAASFQSGSDLITNVGEVPYDNPSYTNINSVGRQWIFRYTLALAKELLAYVRGKYASVPVPGSEATLNQADLLTDSRSEKEALLTNLREMLDQTSRSSQLQRKAEESENLNKTLGGVPMTIFIG
tara:strand:- start:6082 stop:7224 length:1143 start_codon:yes stop_codon:yes gene_type:complete